MNVGARPRCRNSGEAGARIGVTHLQPSPDFPPLAKAPTNAPNMVIVLLDDVGFGWPSSDGGLVRMPTSERLASLGLTYCPFHTTALCAPTRAALLTGRNHHSASSGVVAETATGNPGYSGIRPRSCATIGEILSQNGSATGWWGQRCLGALQHRRRLHSVGHLASRSPEKLRELQDLFLIEAARHDVLPLDDRFVERVDVTLRPSYFSGRKHVTLYPGMVRLPEGSGPKTSNVDHTITLQVSIPEAGAEGVLVCLGGDNAGWTLFVEQGVLRYHYNWYQLERFDVASSGPLPAGDAELQLQFTCETLGKPGGPATVRMRCNGELIGEGRIDKQVMGRFGETLDVGEDKLSPVYPGYRSRLPFKFTGTIRRVDFDFGEAAERTTQELLEEELRSD